MGIKQLTKLLSEQAPACIKENEIKNYFGRKVAIDASMTLYQFLIAIRQDGQSALTDKDGAVTSHLNGLFYRTVRMVENGIKPVYVFDGKPPVMKGGELAKRKARKRAAEEAMEEAKEVGNAEDMQKAGKRSVRVTPEQTEDAKKLLRLMGIPVVEAPCEAEATCAALARAGLVYATATEDMDALTLGTPILLRHLTFSAARKMPIKEIHLDKALEGLDMSMEQFIDLCILLGCDYTETIRGIGPKKAFELMKKYGSIEKVLASLDNEKYKVGEDFNYEGARDLFINADVIDTDKVELVWKAPDEEGLRQYLVEEKGFAAERLEKPMQKLKDARKKKTQGRLDSFFKPAPKTAKVEKKK